MRDIRILCPKGKKMKFDEFKKRYIQAKTRRKPRHIEEDIQTACVSWFRVMYPRYLCFAAPNGGSRNVVEAAHMKAAGVLAGVSDLIIVGDRSVLFVEMKTKTGRQSERQKDFQRSVERLGFEYKVCRSLADFQQVVTRWINDRFA